MLAETECFTSYEAIKAMFLLDVLVFFYYSLQRFWYGLMLDVPVPTASMNGMELQRCVHKSYLLVEQNQ